MKKFLFVKLFILVVCIYNLNYAQWISQNDASQYVNLNDVFTIDDNTAIAVGTYANVNDLAGVILKTTDGGVSWFDESPDTLGDDPIDFYNSTYFINADTGWVLGTFKPFYWAPWPYTKILKTTDGGMTWTADIFQGAPTRMSSINLADDSTGWIVGTHFDGDSHHGSISKTIDGGANWSQHVDLGVDLSSVYFVNRNIGWLAGNLGDGLSISKSTNGGVSWTAQLDTGLYDLKSIYFIDQLTGWAAGGRFNGYDYESTILRTTDGGDNWISQFNGEPGTLLNDLYFVSYSTGWAVGNNGFILSTTDGGVNWIRKESDTDNDLYAVNFADNYTGWIVGENGTILKTLNGGLPVELTSFTGKAVDGNTILNWSTATELNNGIFEIERRKDKSEFLLIGYVDGHGTTTEPQKYSYTDRELSSGKYQYRLKQINFDGSFEYSNVIEVEVNVPKKFALEQNYPNPFNPSTVISYQLPVSSRVTLKVYDLLGKEVATLVNEDKPAGSYEVEFNASSLTSGVYFYRIQSGDFVQARKMILLR